MSGIKITIESARAEDFPALKRSGVYFTFNGERPDGESFCGSADDLETAFSMAKECLRMDAVELVQQNAF